MASRADCGYCIVGMGAVGGIIGLHVYMATGKPPIFVVRRDSSVWTSVRLYGYTDYSYPAVAYRGSPPGFCRVSIVSVKAYDAPDAVESASLYSDMVAIAGNGWGGFEKCLELGLDCAAVVVESGGVSSMRGFVKVSGLGGFVVGSREGYSGAAMEVHRVLSAGGARSILTDNIEGWRWLKASVNASVNPLTAVLGVRNGFILEDSNAWSIASRAAAEVGMVAESLGVELPGDPVEYLARVVSATFSNESSMLQDLRRCRRVEADEILGYILSKARALGLEVPTVETLYRLVRSAYKARCGS